MSGIEKQYQDLKSTPYELRDEYERGFLDACEAYRERDTGDKRFLIGQRVIWPDEQIVTVRKTPADYGNSESVWIILADDTAVFPVDKDDLKPLPNGQF